MEDQTPTRNVKPKLQPTDSTKNVPIHPNLADFPPRQTLESCNVKRNGSIFVLTAPSGSIFTNTAKTRLFSDSTDSLLNCPLETFESSNLKPRKLEDRNPYPFPEVPWTQSENSVTNLRKRPKESLKPTKITSRKLDGKDAFSYREVSLPASDNFKISLKNEAGTRDLRQNIESEGENPFPFPDQVNNDNGPRSSFSRPSLGGSKHTPTSKLYRTPKLSLPANRHRAEAASRLKAMENEQLQASRLAQSRKDLWLDRQERAYSVWLNFVLKQPMKANASSSSLTENTTDSNAASTPSGNRGNKRDSLFRDRIAGGSENEGSWCTPRRNMIKSLRSLPTDGLRSAEKFKARSLQSGSETCLHDVCTVSDLRQRLEIYLDSTDVEDVISTMLKVAKYVEDGRLKMKEECAIVTDVGLKERAVQVLMNYNSTWLRIGLYFVLGHNALVTKEKPCSLQHGDLPAEGNAAADSELLKLVIEKHFFAHAGLSKSFSSNKSIDGLYRPGYYEALGKVILKRLFLFVLALDKAKCQSTLPIRNGIDGLDGGSPLLFWRSTSVKSSRQALQNFLSDVMHGEGDLLGRLATIGYQVFHVQVPLADYDFHVANLIENLRDGVRLCRLVQILMGDASVLMRIIVPCDHHKKNLHNCNVVLQYLFDAGVPLRDEEGYDLTAEDLVAGDRERILSLLWNIFVYLQMPLLISKKQLCDEIIKIKGPEVSDLVMSSNNVPTTIELMLKWIQAICATYGQLVDDFKSLFADGKSFLYLIDFYLPGYMPCSHLLKEPQLVETLDLMMMDSSHNKGSTNKYSLVQDIINHLSNIPEVLLITDFLEGDPSCNERNVIILLTFLCPHLLEGKTMDKTQTHTLKRNKGSFISDKIVSDMDTKQMDFGVQAEQMAAIRIQLFYRSVLQRRQYLKIKEGKKDINKQFYDMVSQERAAIRIQSWWRAMTEKGRFVRIQAAALIIQNAVRAWLTSRQLQRNVLYSSTGSAKPQERRQEKAAIKIQSEYRALMERKQFLKLKTSVSTIQRAIRSWLHAIRWSIEEKAAIRIQFEYRALMERRRFLKLKTSISTIQRAIRSWLHAIQGDIEGRASIIIQSHYRGLTERKRFLKSKAAVLLLQSAVRAWIAAARQEKNHQKAQTAAITIQSHIRGWLQRCRYNLLVTKIQKIQSIYRAYKHQRNQMKAAVKIQCAWKRILIQSKFSQMRYAAIKIQSCLRGQLARKHFKEQKAAAIVIQSWFRRYICQNQYKLHVEALIIMQSAIRGRLMVHTYLKYKNAAYKLQHAFRNWILRKDVEKLGVVCSYITESSSKIQEVKECKLNGFATIIQAAFRGWRERQRYKVKLVMARRIQAFFRGWQVRQKMSLNMSNKQLGYRGMNCTSEDTQLLTKCTKLNISSEPAKTIQQFYHGHATQLLYIKDYKTNTGDVIAPSDLASAKHITRGLIHDIYISNSHKADVDEILNKYIGIVKQTGQFLKVRNSVLKLQRWWRKVLAHRSSSAIVIQSHFRGWLSRKIFSRMKSAILLIQACWRSYLVSKNQVDIRQQLSNLRFRMKNSAANVDDSLRLENRLTKALEALLNHKTVSGILHTCATLDMATQHSKRCCERLVAAGAIDKLLQLINSTNRSAPHEEVLKNALSVLCNISHYPELAQLVVDTPSSVYTIAEQLLRNKEEGFSKAAEILKKLCAVKGGVVKKMAPIIRRLAQLAPNLERKVETERRSLARLPQKAADATRKTGERRLREAESQYQSIVHLLQCVTGESSRRQSEMHKIRRQSDHVLKRTSSGPTELARRMSGGRNPFQDCSNH